MLTKCSVESVQGKNYGHITSASCFLVSQEKENELYSYTDFSFASCVWITEKKRSSVFLGVFVFMTQ